MIPSSDALKSDDPRTTHWSDAAKAGLYLGLATVLFSVIGWLLKLDSHAPQVVNLVMLALPTVFIYIFARKRSLVFGDAGFSYGQSMSFVLSMMLFAGFVFGTGTYIMQNLVAPEYYREIIDRAFDETIRNLGADPGSEIMRQSVQMAHELQKNPIAMAFNGILFMLLFGGLIGLVVSAFVKRPPAYPKSKTDGNS